MLLSFCKFLENQDEKPAISLLEYTELNVPVWAYSVVLCYIENKDRLCKVFELCHETHQLHSCCFREKLFLLL
jgi:hypothetical protein